MSISAWPVEVERLVAQPWSELGLRIAAEGRSGSCGGAPLGLGDDHGRLWEISERAGVVEVRRVITIRCTS